MALTPGTRIGIYEVTAPLGEGGMGQVYRATDTTLGRQVAIKILPDAFAADPERLARFEREAKTLASLNHPHVAQIYGLDRQAGEDGRSRITFIVMELVEGDDLSNRIARGPIPLTEALPIAKQIINALEAAHEQGIVHRDLKPANIKVRDDGTVKVLDFGLAKAIESVSGASGPLSMSPTITTPAFAGMTGAGMILGTAAYMSPEQAKGRVVDKRSDVWAFGCVFFEMLTGRRAFEGEDVTDTIAAVVRGDPDWHALPADVPEQIRLLLVRCLEKDRKVRISDLSVARFLLTETMPEPARGAAASPAGTAPPRPLWRRAVPVAIGAVVAVAVTGTALWMLRPLPPPPVVTRFAIPLGEGQRFINLGRQVLAISPDGKRIVYEAGNRLYLRAMSETEARPIVGTETVQTTNPVFSPDGQSIAFWSRETQVGAADTGVLKRVAIVGGAAVTICPAQNPFGMAWDGDDILFGQGTRGIMRVPANGGKPEVVVAAKDGEVLHGPQMLPGGRAILFTSAAAGGREAWEKAVVVAQSLKTGARTTLVSPGADGRYLPTGHLVYAVDGVAYALRFDPERLAVTGGPVPVIEGVSRARGFSTGTAQFSTSQTGALVYIAGPASTTTAQEDVAFIDRQGTVQPLKLPPDAYRHPRLSPDGNRLAVATDNGKESIVWIYDLSGTSARRRLTFGGQNRFPVWSPDGERVTFQSDRDGAPAIFWQRADGSGTAERLTKPEPGTVHVPKSWSPDGKRLLLDVTKDTRSSLSVFSFQDKQVSSYGGVESMAPVSAQFSADGRWVTYWSSDGLFVQPFPATGAKYQIGTEIHPFWSPDGKELFARPRGGAVVRAIKTSPTFAFGNPVELAGAARFREPGPSTERNMDITPDGKRFIGVISGDQTQSTASLLTIQVVEHWFEELKARVPAR